MPCPQKKHTIHRLCINSKEGYPAKDCDCPPDETLGKVIKATRKRKVKKDELALMPTADADRVASPTSSYLSHLDATTATFFSTGMFYLQLPCPVFRNEINVALYQLQMARGVEDPTVLAVPAYLLNTQPTFSTPSAWHRQPPAQPMFANNMLTKVAGSLVGLGMAALLGYKKWTCLEHHEEVDGVRSSKTTLKPCPFHDHKKVPHHRVRLYGHLPKSSETGLRAHIHDERKNWNFNWDSRDPAEIYSKAEGPINECKIPYKSRHIYLVRHGEYNQDNEHDALRNLTEKGKEQATLAGKRLQELGLTFDKIIISTMTRARETGDCILKELPPEMTEKVVTTDLLREGLPASSEPKSGKFREPSIFFQDGARIEAGFRKYFYRAKPTQERTERLLLVCHANVIRYFICRALQIPEDALLRFSIKHGSITHIEIKPSGRVVARFIGETGFMPENLQKQ
ncbi:uncharacterized protein LOC111247865 isoform X3 [Varroa destructor]|nr:uncharacterized protein LOC111247865 isoform X3 [Varroa destructor]XP_022655084.1 uncharacterized protein LOC111247865 isoform X3 [Varroa destructor]